MEALTPASPATYRRSVADEPFWRHPAWGLAREALRICVSGRPRPISRATWQLSPRPASEPLSLSLPGASGPILVGRLRPDPSCAPPTDPSHRS
jgi:hypothetical protein